MIESTCQNCKRPLDDHTQNQLLTCKIEIGRKTESPLSEDEITNLFNEIKEGEFSRMNAKQKDTREE